MHRKLRASSVSLLIVMLLPACAALAESPEQVPTDGIYPDVIEHPMPDDLSQFKQPASLVADLKAIQTGSLEERLAALADKSKRDQIFVEGGTFQMGDFGRLQSEEKLPWDGRSHSSPLHEVTLDSYSISKYKVTLAEFDLYAEANHVPSVQIEEIYTMSIPGVQPAYRTPDKPAGVNWHQAKAYCQWLGDLTGLAFHLPTEAQWEYSARNRGDFIVYPTDTGKLDWNENVPSRELVKLLNGGFGGLPFPIALFPPNAMGLYDLALNNMDWMADWYSPDYYGASEGAKNPGGPSAGTKKVKRGWPARESGAATTYGRRFSTPQLDITGADLELLQDYLKKKGIALKDLGDETDGFRCAVNNQSSIE